jgi:putative copper resistance protein D
MYQAIVLWIHILSAVIFIGPQIFLVVGVGPAMRTLEDVKQRAQAMRIMTMRFGIWGGGALLLLLITGVINYMHANDEHELDLKRYFIVMQVKLTLVGLVVVMTILHGAVFGRRLQSLQESGAGEAEIARVRQWSMLLSMATLVASVAILLCAALLGSDWSKAGGLR